MHYKHPNEFEHRNVQFEEKIQLRLICFIFLIQIHLGFHNVYMEIEKWVENIISVSKDFFQ